MRCQGGFIQSPGLERAKTWCLDHCVSLCKLMSTWWSCRFNTRGRMRGQGGCHFQVWAVGWRKSRGGSLCGCLLPLNVLLAMWHRAQWGTSVYNCPVVLYLTKHSLGRGKWTERIGRLEGPWICHTSDYGNKGGEKKPDQQLAWRMNWRAAEANVWGGHSGKQATSS